MSDTSALQATQAFFGPRAAGWEARFPNDGQQFARAIRSLDIAMGATVLDLGCGTGRALPLLRLAVGPAGRVIGLDATPEMLGEATRLSHRRLAELILADSLHLPLAATCVDLVFAGGLLPHLADPAPGWPKWRG